ncbi:acetyltransferase, partial [mine drainage metagenome]
GLSCPDNPFILLSFWYAEALIDMEMRDKASEVFKVVLGYSNHLSLFSEEIDLKTNGDDRKFPAGHYTYWSNQSRGQIESTKSR